MQAAIDRGDVLDHECPNIPPIVPETILTGQFWGEQLEYLQYAFRPFLHDGVIIAQSNSFKNVYYGFTSPTVDIGAALFEVFDDEHYFDEACADAYHAEYRRARGQLLADSWNYPEIGEMPVPLTVLNSGRSDDDLKGIKPWFAWMEKQRESGGTVPQKSAKPLIDARNKVASPAGVGDTLVAKVKV